MSTSPIPMKGFISFWLIAAVLVALVAASAVWRMLGESRVGQGGVVCTADAMQCPDGSWVGRSGPNCEFVCPEASTTPAASTTPTGGQGVAPYQSGIAGTVMLGPTCPVVQNPPQPGCEDKPYQTLVAIFRASDPVHAYALLQSGADGTFKAALPPGQYTLGAGESNLPRCNHPSATVGPSGYAQVEIYCDTGIR